MFLVITVTSAPDHLRGYLTRFLSEVDTGVFVGNVSKKVRENLWKRCAQAIREGNLVMINPDPNREAGFVVNTLGPTRREIKDFDGLLLPCTLLSQVAKNSAKEV